MYRYLIRNRKGTTWYEASGLDRESFIEKNEPAWLQRQLEVVLVQQVEGPSEKPQQVEEPSEKPKKRGRPRKEEVEGESEPRDQPGELGEG